MILKIDSPNKISLNIRNLNYRAGNIRHRYSYLSIDVHCPYYRLYTNIGNACDCEHNNLAVTLECVCNNKIAVLYAHVIRPIARPGARGLGPGLGFKYEIVLPAGPGLDILVAGRAGPGPHNSICGPGPGRVFTTDAGPGRAWASNHICGPGLGLDFRPVQDTTMYNAGPLFGGIDSDG